MKIILLFISLLLDINLSFGANPVMHYEPAIVEVTGIIEQQTFPGPPEYESIAKGDRIEKGWYLRFLEPVDVEETKNDAPSAESETERNVRIIQLTWDYENHKLEKKIRETMKKKIKVHLKGYFFHRWSGHHHSRVLMSVDQLEVIKS